MKLQARYPTLLGTALVAGLFSTIVGLLLVIDFTGRGSFELFDSPKYLELKAQLQEKPNDPQIQEQIRSLDLQLRASYFSHRRFMAHGVYLLLGGVVVCLVTARWAAALRPVKPAPEARDEEVDPLQHEQRWGRWAAVAVVAAVLLLMCGFALRADRILSVADIDSPSGVEPRDAGNQGDEERQGTGQSSKSDDQAANDGQQVAVPVPAYDEYLKQWPRFRGPTGAGTTQLRDIPQQWNVEDGSGILWKTTVPLPGPNSPVVWGDKLFVSGATAEQQAVFCFNADSGEQLWRLDIPLDLGGVEDFEVADYTGYAAPTVATDGVRVYAIFASGNLVAADFEGQQLWRMNLGVPENNYGHASSLATHKDLLIVQYYQGTGEEENSRLMAIRGVSGKIAWEKKLAVPSSWTSPIVVRQGERAMVITSVEPCLFAHNADDGTELWRAEVMEGEIGPSPVYANGVVYVANESCGLYAVRADGEGDVTDTHIEWFTDIILPDVVSPLVTDKHLIVLSHGLLTAYELGPNAEDADPEEPREPLWEEDLLEEVSSSPGLAGDLIYLFSEEGKAWILKSTADACERVAELEMGEPVRSSPAFRPGRIYIRGEKHLFCIGK